MHVLIEVFVFQKLVKSIGSCFRLESTLIISLLQEWTACVLFLTQSLKYVCQNHACIRIGAYTIATYLTRVQPFYVDFILAVIFVL